MRVGGVAVSAGVGCGARAIAAGAAILALAHGACLGRHAEMGADPGLSEQSARSTPSARRCAPPMKPCPQALSGYRPRVSLTASAGEQYLDTHTKTTSAAGSATYSHTSGNRRRAELRRNDHADAAERIRHREPHAAGRATGVGGARDAAADRADRAAQRRHRLHEPDPRRRDPAICSAATSRCCRSSFARPAIASTSAKSRAPTWRKSESRLAAARASMLTAESNYTTSRSTYRQVIGVEPGTLAPASPVDRLSPQSLHGGGRRGAGAASGGHHRDVQRRCRGVPGQDRGKLALSDPQPGRQRPAELRLDDRR